MFAKRRGCRDCDHCRFKVQKTPRLPRHLRVACHEYCAPRLAKCRAGDEDCTSTFTKHCTVHKNCPTKFALHGSQLTAPAIPALQGHISLPPNPHVNVHKALRLPQNLHFEFSKIPLATKIALCSSQHAACHDVAFRDPLSASQCYVCNDTYRNLYIQVRSVAPSMKCEACKALCLPRSLHLEERKVFRLPHPATTFPLCGSQNASFAFICNKICISNCSLHSRMARYTSFNSTGPIGPTGLTGSPRSLHESDGTNRLTGPPQRDSRDPWDLRA